MHSDNFCFSYFNNTLYSFVQFFKYFWIKGDKRVLVTFSCDAYENITMFGDVAQHLLKMMGHSGTVPSAILAEDVPEALQRLQTAINKTSGNISARNEEDSDGNVPVSLKNRALPLIELLKAAVSAKCIVMWKAQ